MVGAGHFPALVDAMFVQADGRLRAGKVLELTVFRPSPDRRPPQARPRPGAVAGPGSPAPRTPRPHRGGSGIAVHHCGRSESEPASSPPLLDGVAYAQAPTGAAHDLHVVVLPLHRDLFQLSIGSVVVEDHYHGANAEREHLG